MVTVVLTRTLLAVTSNYRGKHTVHFVSKCSSSLWNSTSFVIAGSFSRRHIYTPFPSWLSRSFQRLEKHLFLSKDFPLLCILCDRIEGPDSAAQVSRWWSSYNQTCSVYVKRLIRRIWATLTDQRISARFHKPIFWNNFVTWTSFLLVHKKESSMEVIYIQSSSSLSLKKKTFVQLIHLLCVYQSTINSKVQINTSVPLYIRLRSYMVYQHLLFWASITPSSLCFPEYFVLKKIMCLRL